MELVRGAGDGRFLLVHLIVTVITMCETRVGMESLALAPVRDTIGMEVRVMEARLGKRSVSPRQTLAGSQCDPRPAGSSSQVSWLNTHRRSPMTACAIRFRLDGPGPATFLVECDGDLRVYTRGVLGGVVPQSRVLASLAARGRRPGDSARRGRVAAGD